MTFNEAEAYQPKEEAPVTIVKSYERKSRSGSVEDVVPDDAPVKVVEHRLPEEERTCAQCGTTMQEIGKEVRRTLVLVPAIYYVQEDHYFTYACKNCKVTGTEVPVQRIKQAKAVIAGNFASPEISVVGCRVHARRKFDEALNSLPKTHQKGSAAAQGIAYYSALFKIKEEITELF